MKKRLLSAALALAMVLTLLPLSAFAADDFVPGTSSVTYYKADSKFSDDQTTVGTTGWYYSWYDDVAQEYKHERKATGVVLTGNAGAESGTYFSDFRAALVAVNNGSNYGNYGYGNCITLIDGSSSGFGTETGMYPRRDLTIDLHGVGGASLPGTIYVGTEDDNGGYGTRLTITDSLATGSSQTALTASISSSRDNIEITLEHVNLNGGITSNFNTSSKVTLTNSTVVGDINLNGTPAANSNKTCGGGEVSLSNSTAKDITITHDATNGTSSGGTISLTASKAVNLKVVHNTTGTSSGGTITVNNSNVSASTRVISQRDGSISATDASTGTIQLNGVKSTLSGANSRFETIRLFGTGSQAVVDSYTATYGSENLAPSVTLSGQSTAKAIMQDTSGEKVADPYIINIQNASINETVTLPYANITVSRGGVTGETKLEGGTLDLTGNGVTMGKITLGKNDNGAAVTVNATGSNITTKEILAVGGNLRHINLNIGPDMTNKFGVVAADSTVKCQIDVGRVSTGAATVKIEGGNFDGWLDEEYVSNMEYAVIETGQVYEYSYYNSDQMNDLVSRWQSADSTGNSIRVDVLRQEADYTKLLKLVDNRTTPEKTLLEVHYGDASFKLPTKASNMPSVQWAKMSVKTVDSVDVEEVIDVYSGGSQFHPQPNDYDDKTHQGTTTGTANTVTLYVQNADYSINKINRVRVLSSSNQRISAELSGNTIVLHGTVDKPSGTSTIPLVLETDNGDVTVSVDFTNSGGVKTTSFLRNVYPSGAMTVSNDGLSVTVGNTRYTLNGSDIHGRVNGLTQVNVGQIITTVTSSVDNTDKGRYDMGVSMSSDTGFVIANSPAILQALGRIEAGLTEDSISSYLAEAQRKAWDKLPANQGKTPNTGEIETTGYSSVYLVPYLDVQLTDWNDRSTPGLLTATVTPSYKIEVRPTSENSNYAKLFKKSDMTDPDAEPLHGAIVVAKGSLGTLSDDVGKIEITMKVPGFKDGTAYAHQDNAYVSTNAVTITSGGTTSATVNFDLYHKALTGGGLGTIQINTQKPLVELVRHADNAGKDGVYDHLKYDTLQAAVNDTMNGDTIFISDGYKSADTITVTGRAREFYIEARGNTGVSAAQGASGVVVTQSTAGIDTGTSGRKYIVQLSRDTIATTTPDKEEDEVLDVTISVVGVSNGSASVSATRAKTGDVISVAVSPASGYVFNGLTIRGNTGYGIGYTTVSTNNFRFTIPAGVTSITVTPSFARTATGATVIVSNVANGTATTSAGDNRVPGGTSVTVSVSPNTGYRTMGLYVTSDVTATTSATRTGVNSFVFTVPTNATNVVVTPRFDVNNGTVFEDVWSTEYFSSAVAWAVGRSITDGTSTYTFSPYNNCTRAEMVTFLWRAAGSPAVTGVTNPFWDVQAGTYYYDAVMWAVSKGITNGVEWNRFGVNEYVTRGQAVTFLYRYEGSPAASTSSVFRDVSAREYYAPAVAWAVNKGVTNGTSSTLFSPNAFCQRCQIVTFLYRDITNTRA